MLIRPLLPLLLALLPRADASLLEVQLQSLVRAGERPALTVTATAPIARLRAELRRADGRALVVEHGRLGAGEHARLEIAEPQRGRSRWTGKLVATRPDGSSASFDLDFETAVGGTLQVGYDRAHLDLDAHRLGFTLSRPAQSATLRVFGDDGALVAEASAAYHGERPGTWLDIDWAPRRAATVLRLELRAVAQDGLATVAKLYPWAVAVAHDEVAFATGQAEIRPSEEAKLDASYGRILAAIDKARRADPSVNVRLFIAGHTDTVGPAADNRRLSLARARAIAAWFRDHGLPLPVLYAGVGEDAPKVKTPDNTDEAANRRADYIVGIDEPEVARGLRTAWHPL